MFPETLKFFADRVMWAQSPRYMVNAEDSRPDGLAVRGAFHKGESLAMGCGPNLN